MRVLVVDDSRAMRMIVGRELREVAAVDEVAEAESGEAAIEILGCLPIDLVICDCNLAGLSGIELLEALRAAGWAVPFGFVTSASDADIAGAAEAAGAAFVLAKPFAGEVLRERVAAVLAGRSPAGARSCGEPASAGGVDGAGGDGPERAGELRELLEGLLRTVVRVVPVPVGPPRQAPRVLAEYVGASGAMVAWCVVEAPLASAMSAALTVLPPGLAAEWAAAGALPDVLTENFHEVANVMAKALRAGGARCALGAVSGFAPGEQLPDIGAIRAARQQESFAMAVDGYGTGLLCLVTL